MPHIERERERELGNERDTLTEDKVSKNYFRTQQALEIFFNKT